MRTLKIVLFLCFVGIVSASNQQRWRRLRQPQSAEPRTSKERLRQPATAESRTSEGGRRRQASEPGNELSMEARAKRSYDSIYERWLDIISQYGRKDGGNSIGNTPWSPFPVDLPIGGGRDGKPSIMPVLILPVPVPYANSRGECSANQNAGGNSGNQNKYGNGLFDVRLGLGQHDDFDDNDVKQTVSSDYLIDLFHKQQPFNPELPPAVFDDYAPQILHPSLSNVRGFGSNVETNYLPPARQATPSPPRFDKSLIVKGFLTVHSADYTEAYTAMYDAKSGSTRMEYHDHAAMSIRSMTPDGSVQRFVRHTDRTTEQDIRVCGVSSPSRASAEDRAPPMLPSTEGFTFGGFKEEFGMPAEVWQRVIVGRPGELGAGRGESLTYRHQMLVHRKSDDTTIPLKYTVSVDSSVLGPNSEGYEHIYSEVREKEHDMYIFKFDPARECEQQEQLNPNNPSDMARLEPIREFTMPHRDPRYDQEFETFTKQFERSYSDDKETCLRKTLLISNLRFISSCNRQSGTFTLGVNFLSDRLASEIEILLGAEYDESSEANVISFPFSERNVKDIGGKLPKEFDWRPRGAVSPVKLQGDACSSCWAFAVVGSVEGAFFIRTSQLVEFSEQTLVDCGHSHGCHGCKGTWPAAAFNYVKDRGLPKRDEYTPYKAKVLQCKAPPVPPVTHIEGFLNVTPNNIDALKVAIRRIAPTVVVVDAKCHSFINYQRGVLHDERCIKAPKKKLNHAVLAVGWGELRNDPYFIIKNSWSTFWGEGGYINLHAPSNTCGHLTTPETARLRRRNIDRLPAGATPWKENDGFDDDDEQR